MVEYVGLDVSKEETAFCVKDEDGKVLASGKVSTDPESIFAALKEHFTNSRNVGADLGLTSRRWQSGKVDYGGRISRHGDKLLRSLLYAAANSMLTVLRRAHPLAAEAGENRRIGGRTEQTGQEFPPAGGSTVPVGTPA